MTGLLKAGRIGLTLGFALLSVFVATALVANDADARRLGGGRSFGKQSSTFNQRQALPPSKPVPGQEAAKPGQPPAAAPAPQPAGNRWLGPLAGIAAGLGIGALLSHFGLGGAFADGLGSMLVIGLLLFAGIFIWRMLRRSTASSGPMRPMEPAYAMPAPAARNSGGEVSVLGTPLPGASSPASENADAPWGVPADFDVAGFLRSAKVYFIRLQAAWDAKDLPDIREFTTPEVFAEIRMQLDEEKGAINKTDVINLDAVLLGIETGPTDYLASVRFSGSMRENQAESASFEEVWNLSKPVNGRGGWLLAGIQQLQ